MLGCTFSWKRCFLVGISCRQRLIVRVLASLYVWGIFCLTVSEALHHSKLRETLMASMKTIAEANVMLGHPLVRDDGEAVKVKCHGSSSATHNNIGSALKEKARRIMADAVLDGVQTTRLASRCDISTPKVGTATQLSNPSGKWYLEDSVPKCWFSGSVTFRRNVRLNKQEPWTSRMMTP